MELCELMGSMLQPGYTYRVSSRNTHDFMSIISIDAGVLRRLSFVALYKVKCSAVSGEVAQSTLASVAQGNFQQLNRICGEGKVSFL